MMLQNSTKFLIITLFIICVVFVFLQGHLLSNLKSGISFHSSATSTSTSPLAEADVEGSLEGLSRLDDETTAYSGIYAKPSQKPGETCEHGFGTVPDYSINSKPPGKIPIISSSEIDSREFLREYIEKSQPALITNWSRRQYERILRFWAIDDYLMTKVPNYEVNVEISEQNGRFGYEEKSWKRVMMPFHEFLKEYKKEEGRMYLSNDIWPSERRNGLVSLPSFIYCLNKEQDDISHGGNAPRGDRNAPDHSENPVVSIDEQTEENTDSFPFYTEFGVWFSAGGTNSLIHNDPHDNLLLQVDGYKKIYLFPPTIGQYLQEKLKAVARTSTIDLQDPATWENYPGFKEYAWKHRIELVLTPGDMLFLPTYWFHQVHSSCRNIAINFWFDTFNMEWLLNRKSTYNLPSDELIVRAMQQRSQCLDVNQNRRRYSGRKDFIQNLSWYDLYSRKGS